MNAKSGATYVTPGRTVLNQQTNASLSVIPNHHHYSLQSQCMNCGDVASICIPKGTPCQNYVSMCNNCGCKEKRAVRAVNAVLFGEKTIGGKDGKWWERR